MSRFLCLVALALAAFAVIGDKPAAFPAATPTYPLVVAKVAGMEQTQAIPTTKIFNVTESGLYRITTYITAISGQSSGYAIVVLNYTDHAGPEEYYGSELGGGFVPPAAYGLSQAGDVANSFTFIAVSGTPISFSVTYSAPLTYDVAIVVERLA
jgi:hypothetical protein